MQERICKYAPICIVKQILFILQCIGDFKSIVLGGCIICHDAIYLGNGVIVVDNVVVIVVTVVVAADVIVVMTAC